MQINVPILCMPVPNPVSTAYHPLQHDGGLVDGISEGNVWACNRAFIGTVAVTWDYVWSRCSAGFTLPQYVQGSNPEFVGHTWSVEWTRKVSMNVKSAFGHMNILVNLFLKTELFHRKKKEHNTSQNSCFLCWEFKVCKSRKSLISGCFF